MKANEPSHLPKELRDQLANFRKRLWKIKILEAGLAALFGLVTAFLFVFLLDRIIDTPAWLRLILLVSGASLLTIFTPHWLHRWVWKHRRDEQIARLIRQADPSFGDRLLGIVELDHQHESAGALSPTLRRAATEQVAREALEREFDNNVPNPMHRRWGLAVALLVAIVGGAFLYAPEAGKNALTRWMMPFSETERFTFTQLEPIKSPMIVPRGEAFDINVILSTQSERVPDIATVTVGQDLPFSVPRKDMQYAFRFNGLLDPTTIDFTIGDARRKITVIPTERPGISELTGTITLPEYLQYDDIEVDLTDGRITFIEGANLMLRGKSTNPLNKASLNHITPPSNDTNKDQPEPSKIIQLPTLTVNDHAFTANAPINAAILPAESAEDLSNSDNIPAEIAISVRDQNNLTIARPFQLIIRTTRDAPPTTYIEGLGRDVAILEKGEILEFKVVGGDDYGVARIGIEYYGEPSSQYPLASLIPTTEQILREGAPRALRIEEFTSFSPELLNIGPQVIILRSFSEDYKPGRERTYSEPHRIIVMDTGQHAENIRERFGKIMDNLEELARREEANLQENQRLADLNPDQLQNEDTLSRIQEQRELERENRQQMENLHEAASDLFRDALRNEEIQQESMREWAELMENLRQLAEEGMPSVEEALEQAATPPSQPSPPSDPSAQSEPREPGQPGQPGEPGEPGQPGEPGESPESDEQAQAMQEAVEAQEEVIEQMREALRNANITEQNMEAGTFAARFRKAARDSQGIVSGLRQGVLRSLNAQSTTPSVGANPEDLSREDFAGLVDLATVQESTYDAIRFLETDLGSFFRRTTREIFEEIRSEMEEEEIISAYNRLTEQIRNNWAGRTVPELNAWTEQLNEWADRLDPREDSGGGDGGGGGGGGGEEGPDDSDYELMLQLLRFVQQEQDLRARTRAVDQLRQQLAEEGAIPPIDIPQD